MRILKRVHFHPFLMGIFPVISLYASNQSQLEAAAPWRSLAVILAGTVIVFVLLRWIVGDWTRAGFITTFASFLFFIYGPIKVFISLKNSQYAGLNGGLGHYLLPALFAILAVGIWLLVWKIPHGETSLLIFNVIAIATLILPVISIASYSLSHARGAAVGQSKAPARARLAAQPDIYYIILDMYGRSDTIEDKYGFDNSAFLAELRKQGFYVAACSSSNYTQTALSLASSLNMDYLTAYGKKFAPGKPYRDDAGNLIKDSTVRQYLAQYGYKFVSFENRFSFINITNSDVFIRMPNSELTIQPFELLLIEQTPAIVVLNELEKIAAAHKVEDLRKYGSVYDATQYVLNAMTRLPTSIQSPKFVYVHLVIPHPPYVIGPNGEYTGDSENLTGGTDGGPINLQAEKLGYTNQVKYLNSRMPKIVAQIIATSKNPPVIIIQGDHGFKAWNDGTDRLAILNAYYLPGKDASKLLYQSITPVNSFRMVLDAYFNGQFKLLPDLNYLSDNSKGLFDAALYPNQSIACQAK